MDPHKSAANRVRHILQAMERSIDSARARRVGHDTGAGHGTGNGHSSENGTHETRTHAADLASRTSGSTASPLAPAAAAPAYPARQMNSGNNANALTQRMIGAPAAPHTTNAPAPGPATQPQLINNNGQPPRLKAKPKRFDGATFNSQFAPPPAYRSQTG